MKGGENVADFEKIFKENQGFIYKYLLKLCGNPSLAEELTQETFFRAYMNISSLRNESKVSVWLCQIAKNTYYAWYNENKKLNPIDDAKEVKDSFDAEDFFVQRELTEKALSCLHKLEEPYKEVFMLSVFGQVSLKDISRIFGKSESWARVTFYRAKQKLSEGMKEHNEM
ncbi:MAG: sigma-70 family RNA polymerase sigma factor [Clostridia bacterium]|nr:sigma-70 family RNA polymerase sigma factor [Clostridia bacterium]